MDYRKLRYDNIQTMYWANGVIDAVRKQDYDSAIRKFRHFLTYFQQELNILLAKTEFLKQEGITVSTQEIMQMLSDTMAAQEQKDYILLADILEIVLIPFLLSLQENVTQKIEGSLFADYFEENCEALSEQNPLLTERIQKAYARLRYENNGKAGELYEAADGTCYLVEDTKYGFPTLSVIGQGGVYYLHSNKNPLEEAFLWASAYEEIDNESVTMMGAGLLYQATVLGSDFYEELPIHVYEPDCNILAIALRYRELKMAFRKYLFLHYDENLLQLSERIKAYPNGFFIHAPSLRNIKNKEIKKSFEKFFISDSSMRTQKRTLALNFKSNVRHLVRQTEKTGVIDEIISDFAGKDIYIIAAGPSLDKNIELLRNRTERMLIFATGTVFRKVMSLGIRPDFVLITDPNSRIINQLSGREQETVPMLLLSTAWQRFIPVYKGQKYLVFQKDFPQAEEMAAENDYTLFETGGSVSTTALDIAIRGKAARVIFLGLDLAFTNHLAHASGTSNQKASNKEDLFQVKDFYGGKVDTDYKFTIYREWIEKHIAEMTVPMPEIINATEGGSYIQGMKHLPLRDVIQ